MKNNFLLLITVFRQSIIAFTCCFGIVCKSEAQNLVPNPGFESFTTCPVGFSEFNGHVSNWINPSIASPDYMNACANPFPAGVPENGTGYQLAHGGNAYVGCYLSGGGIYMEYVQVQLAATLEAGKTYQFKMYTVLHNNSNKATDDVGAYISVAAPTSTGTGYLSGYPEPQITNPSGSVITDTLNWQLVSGTYTATGGENYLTIGHFKPDAQTIYLSLPYGSQGAYYYFDDISLEPMQSVGFNASDTSVCEKFCIDFTDQSTNDPVSWLWNFPGGTPSSSSLQNPFQVCYQEPGVFDVTLITTNANGSDTLTLTDYVTVHSTPPIPAILQDGFTLTCSSAFSYQWQFNAVDIPGATDQTYVVTQSGTYTVIVLDENGCKNSESHEVIISGVDEIMNESNVVVYPNPNNGHFILDGFLKPGDIVSIEIENAMGMMVYSKEEKLKGNSIPIAISHLSPGVYVINLKTNGGVISKKLLIE
ncbi:MAG: PKD domain-containing protein [Chitinophagaceae bacterium]|nr:PKD domain-containing protein [Chitinophagaceae bacterium]